MVLLRFIAWDVFSNILCTPFILMSIIVDPSALFKFPCPLLHQALSLMSSILHTCPIAHTAVPGGGKMCLWISCPEISWKSLPTKVFGEYFLLLAGGPLGHYIWISLYKSAWLDLTSRHWLWIGVLRRAHVWCWAAGKQVFLWRDVDSCDSLMTWSLVTPQLWQLREKKKIILHNDRWNILWFLHVSTH